jgi:hypothetical protein
MALGLTTTASAASLPAIPELSSSLRYQVRGEVPIVCSLANPSEGEVIEFSAAVDGSSNTGLADTVRLPFSIACNTPMSVKMESDNGGLNNDATTSDTDFTSLFAYTAQLNLPNRANALSCSSAHMKIGAGGCSGTISDAVTQGQGGVDVTLNPDGRLLLQGTYADRLTITLSPILGGQGV